MNAAPSAGTGRILLTVEVEDYFQVGRFGDLIQRDQWYRFESRIEHNTRKALDLLDQFGIRATFFVLGWVADNLPELVRDIARRGHEVAGMTSEPLTIRGGPPDPQRFREDLARCRESLERVTGRRLLGNRVPLYLGPEQLWALDVLAEEGYAYDSSLRPIMRGFAGEPWRRAIHQHAHGDHRLWELPLSTSHLLGLSLPIAGAGYFRHLPHALMKRAVKRWHARQKAPFVMYFRVWELDPEQPRIEASGRIERLRHYRNLEKMERVLSDYFRTYPVCGIAEHLGLDTGQPAAAVARPSERPVEVRVSDGAGAAREGVSVVIPCYNEEKTLPYLANTLRSVEGALGGTYDLRFIFVDDGSRDQTHTTLVRLFGGRPNCSVIHHERNRGVAAAILSGVRAAATEVVCSIDCDCTYDPHELRQMIPLLGDDVGMVTASPYHPQGRVRNVPPWRLSLSRVASFLYRRVLRQKLHTYTSCFRVYRRSVVEGLELAEPGFLGVAETLGRLDLKRIRIVEHPSTLQVRIFGHSKMKTLRTIFGHLRLLSRLAALRASQGLGRRGKELAPSAGLRGADGILQGERKEIVR